MTLDVEYDPEADAAYVYLRRARQHRTRELDSRRIIDLAADGSIIGIEFLDVSEGVNVAGLPAADAVAKALTKHGIAVRQPVR